MKNYSFSNIANEDSYTRGDHNQTRDYPTRNQYPLRNEYPNRVEYTRGEHPFRHSELSCSQASQRIEDIKKKYDTPSRRQRIDSLKKSKDFQLGKENYTQHRAVPSFGTNCLRQSFAVNRLEKSSLRGQVSGKEVNIRREESGFRLGAREQEEALFSKMREMKESLINNDYMRSSGNGRGVRPIEGRRDFDPRVENIDKINSKIKQILSCLTENQKAPSKYLREDRGERTESSFLRERESLGSFVGEKGNISFGFRGDEPAGKDSSCLVRNVAEPKRAYEGHAQKGSDVLEKINLDAKVSVIEPKESKTYETKEVKTYETKEVKSYEPKEVKAYEPKEVKSYEPKLQKQQADRQLQKIKQRDYSVNRIDIKDYSISRPRKDELSRTPSQIYSKNQDVPLALKGSRSRSQLDPIRKSNLAENDVLRSGKKLNDEISRIQRKIEEFQKEKRKLNIEFTPFGSKNRSSVSLLKGRDNQQQSETRDVRQVREARQIREVRLPAFDEKSIDTRSKQTQSKEGVRELNAYRPNREGNFELKIQQVQVKTSVQSRSEVQQQSRHQLESQPHTEVSTMRIDRPEAEDVSELNIGLKNEVDGGIEQRKKRLLTTQQIISTDSLKKLVSLFCEQAKLDQDLRNLKIWLQSVSDQDKFSRMTAVLSKQGVTISPQQSQRIFTLDESQNNPFFSVQGFDGNYSLLAHAYTQAQQHWSSCVQHKFSQSALTGEGFTAVKLDLQKKGFVQLQDLVRFLNIESGTFYRNRDLFLIFRRLSSTDRTSFQQLLGEICA